MDFLSGLPGPCSVLELVLIFALVGIGLDTETAESFF